MSNIILNVIPFDHPEESIDFGFSLNKTQYRFPLRREDFPVEVKEHFGKSLSSLKTIYGEPVFEGNNYEIVCSIDCASEPGMLKHHYRNLIKTHFLNHADIVTTSFVGDNMLYFKQPSDNLPYTVYKVYTIKILLSRIYDGPHFAITYNGIQSFYDKPISDLTHLPFGTIRTVLFNKRLYRYGENAPEFLMENQTEVYPKLGYKLKTAVGISIKPKKIHNKYTHFYSEINSFIKSHIFTDAFRAIFPIHDSAFLPSPSVHNLPEALAQLAYRNNKTGLSPKTEFRKFKAAKSAPIINRKLLVIYNPKDKFVQKTQDASGNEIVSKVGVVNKFFGAIKNGCETTLSGGYKYKIPPLNEYISSNFELSKEGTQGIEIKSDESTIDDIRQALAGYTDLETTEYVAIVLLPHVKEERTPDQAKLYAGIKEILLQHGISSQCLLKDTISNSEFIWSYSNASITLLAKMGGMPWKLAQPIQDELIIGLGAFSSQELNCKFVGSAFSFGSDGKFEGLNCFRADDMDILLSSIHHAIRGYKTRLSTQAKRMVIHFYKEMRRVDYEKIMKVINSHEWDIPVITININTSVSEDFIGFDKSATHLMPVSGTYIPLDDHSYLLYNNTRYTADTKPQDGYHLPIKLSFSSNHPDTLDDSDTIKELIGQVYQFSRLYWKSTKHQNIPVTVKFPEMAAKIYAKFDNPDLGAFGESNLWFL